MSVAYAVLVLVPAPPRSRVLGWSLFSASSSAVAKALSFAMIVGGVVVAQLAGARTDGQEGLDLNWSGT